MPSCSTRVRRRHRQKETTMVLTRNLWIAVQVSAGALCCLIGTSGAMAQPGGPTGGCCVVDDAGVTRCTVVRHEACERLRGVYQGNGVACGVNGACPNVGHSPPTGACCVTSAAGVVTCT